jgi:hypothetical protein
MTFPNRLVAAFGLAAGLFAFPGCRSPIISANQRPDGIYHLKCRDKLQRCLDEVETLCRHNRYVVLRAFDDHEWEGYNWPQQDERRASEAFIRCGQKPPWGEDSPMGKLRADPLGEVTSEPAPVAPSPARVCIPGASQACVGPDNCSGGQVCRPDGVGFGPCDCGADR